MRWLWLLCLPWACVPIENVDYPGPPAGGSALLFLTGSNSNPQGWALGDADAAPPISLGPRDELWFVVYDQPLGDLGLVNGQLQLDLRPDGGRPIPSGGQLHRATTETSGFKPLNTLDELTRVIGDRPLSDECAGADDCRVYAGVGSDTVCATQCTDPDVAVPLPPAPPERPRFETCPAGWSKTSVGQMTPPIEVCQPPARQGLCEPGFIQPAGSVTCTALGECPSLGEDFGVMNGPAIFVLAGGPAGGDGSRANPVATIAEALALPGNDPIFLSRGEHAAPAEFVGRSLIGACAAETRLLAPNKLRLIGGRLEALTVVGPNQTSRSNPSATALETTGNSELENVEVQAMQPWRVVETGTTTAHRVRVRGIGATPAFGVLVLNGSVLRWDAGSVENARERALNVFESHVVLSDLVFGTIVRADPARRAFNVFSDLSTVDLRRSRIAYPDGNHLAVFRGTAELEDLWFEGGASDRLATRDKALDVHLGSTVRARRLVFTGVDSGLWVFSGKNNMELEDSVFVDFEAGAIEVNPDCTLRVDRVAIDGGQLHGILIRNNDEPNLDGDDGADVTMNDVSISQVGGRGIEMTLSRDCRRWPFLPVNTQVNRLRVEDTGSDGVRLFSTAPQSQWNDVSIYGAGRHGFLAAIDSAVAMSRVQIENTARVGLWLEQYRVDLPDVVEFTREVPVNDVFVSGAERGVWIGGAFVRGRTWHVENVSHSGILWGSSEGSLRDVGVTGVGDGALTDRTGNDRTNCQFDPNVSLRAFPFACIGLASPEIEVGTGIHVCGFRASDFTPIFFSEVDIERAEVSDFARYGISAYRFAETRLTDTQLVGRSEAEAGTQAGVVIANGVPPETVFQSGVQFKDLLEPIAVQ